MLQLSNLSLRAQSRSVLRSYTVVLDCLELTDNSLGRCWCFSPTMIRKKTLTQMRDHFFADKFRRFAIAVKVWIAEVLIFH